MFQVVCKIQRGFLKPQETPLCTPLFRRHSHCAVTFWRGFAAHCHFHCFVLLQCASGEHDPSFIVPTMLPWKWAILLALGTFSCPPFSCPVHLLLGAGGGRQGQYIQPREKKGIAKKYVVKQELEVTYTFTYQDTR